MTPENGPADPKFTIRPIRPEDEPMMVRFHETLSLRSVYLRYFHMMNLDSRTDHERLKRICSVDAERETVLVVEIDAENENAGIVAVGRLIKEDSRQAEFAVLIADPFQGHGLGTELLRRLIEIGRAEKLERITGEILPENDSMLHVCRQLGFELHHSLADHVVRAELKLAE
jgi:acetyltransferase